jgi:hypothetical protein
VIISPLRRARPFLWTNLNPLHLWMICTKFEWNWPSGSGEDFFFNFLVYFYIFAIISPWKWPMVIIWTNLNPLPPRMICTKFGWNWLSGSGEEVENVNVYRRTDRRTPGDQNSSLELSLQLFGENVGNLSYMSLRWKNKIWSG